VQLPVLEVEGEHIAQMGSILRYISRMCRKDGPDPIQAARADSAFEAAQEISMTQVYVAVNLMEEDQAKQTALKFKAALPRYLKNWSKILDGTAYFHGAQRLQRSAVERCLVFARCAWLLIWGCASMLHPLPFDGQHHQHHNAVLQSRQQQQQRTVVTISSIDASVHMQDPTQAMQTLPSSACSTSARGSCRTCSGSTRSSPRGSRRSRPCPRWPNICHSGRHAATCVHGVCEYRPPRGVASGTLWCGAMAAAASVIAAQCSAQSAGNEDVMGEREAQCTSLMRCSSAGEPGAQLLSQLCTMAGHVRATTSTERSPS
jgi:hypothetical protein